jgi:hypothetical protein
MKFEVGGFLPVLFVDEFWLLKDQLIAINETLESLPLTLSYSPISLLRWQMMLQMEQSFAMQQSMGTAVSEETDDFKVQPFHLSNNLHSVCLLKQTLTCSV